MHFLSVQMMVNGEKERMSLLFMKALVSAGSMDAVSQQMASHPQYLESFLRTQHYILHMDGPLPLPCRHYIAIMVSEPPPPSRWPRLFLSRSKEHFNMNVALVNAVLPQQEGCRFKSWHGFCVESVCSPADPSNPECRN